MKVILVDDEPMMHLIMRKMLVKLPEVEVAGAFTDTKSAGAFLSENADIQLAFVDISMPGESGMKFAARMEDSGSQVQIVFVTSHKEYALEAYELSVLDYLVKPVSQERLERTVNRALAAWRTFQEPRLENQSSGQLVVTALGDVAVRNEMGRVKWISRKSAELFAYLLLCRGKRIPRSRLIADIFAGMSSVGAEIYLNTVVYQLRKSLESLQLRAAVISENDGYVLELNEASIDYEEFESKAEKLQAIEAANVENALQIERLYTGDLFGDKAYVWAINDTERLAELYASFVKRLAGTLVSLSDTAAALKLLSKLHARNPLDESVVRLLMEVYAVSLDKKGLTVQYTNYVRLLSRELGIRPSQELILLYDSLLRGFSDKK